MPASRITAKVKRQMKFYRWLVLEFNDEIGQYQILPCETKEQAEALVAELSRYRGAEHFTVFDARVDDDWNLFWSATSLGYPLESHPGVA